MLEQVFLSLFHKLIPKLLLPAIKELFNIDISIILLITFKIKNNSWNFLQYYIS